MEYYLEEGSLVGSYAIDQMSKTTLNGEEVYNACETIEGEIAHEVLGTNGFGYDPIFYVPEFGMTTAQMPLEQKNSISHRGQALKKMVAKLG